MTLPQNLLSTTQADLQVFVANSTREGPNLEFKRELPATWKTESKHEFLADVTAFANAGGGDLIFGIDEDGDGQATAITPMALANPDDEIRKLQDFLLNVVEPRLPGVQLHPVAVSVSGVNGFALVVRVPQSWVGPHRVKTNQHFYVRDGLRKRQLDIPEIRALFLRSESQAQRVRDFRTERLGKILSGQAPHRLVDGPMLVVHLVPTQAALGLVQIDPVTYTSERPLPVIGCPKAHARLNLDGALVVRNESSNGETHGYSQLFRNGFFEATHVLTYRQDGGPVYLSGAGFEQDLIAFPGGFRGELDRLGVDLECAVMLSLLRAHEVKLAGRNQFAYLDRHQARFDRQAVVLPEVIAKADATPQLGLRPAFDLMWQAAGFIGSENYNQAGEWNAR